MVSLVLLSFPLPFLVFFLSWQYQIIRFEHWIWNVARGTYNTSSTYRDAHLFLLKDVYSNSVIESRGYRFHLHIFLCRLAMNWNSNEWKPWACSFFLFEVLGAIVRLVCGICFTFHCKGLGVWPFGSKVQLLLTFALFIQVLRVLRTEAVVLVLDSVNIWQSGVIFVSCYLLIKSIDIYQIML